MNGMKLGTAVLGCLALAASCTDAFAAGRSGFLAICEVGNISIIDASFKSRLGKMKTGDRIPMAVTGEALAIDPDYAVKIDPENGGAGLIMPLFATDRTETGYIPRYAHDSKNDRLVFNIVDQQGNRFAILATAWEPKPGQKLASAAAILECTMLPGK